MKKHTNKCADMLKMREFLNLACQHIQSKQPDIAATQFVRFLKIGQPRQQWDTKPTLILASERFYTPTTKTKGGIGRRIVLLLYTNGSFFLAFFPKEIIINFMKIFITDLSKIGNKDVFLKQKASLLTPTDTARFSSFRSKKRRIEFLAGRLMIYRFFGTDFTIEKSGKLTSPRGYFSLTHSGDLVALAISDSPVGIDAEDTTRKRNYKDVSRFLHLGDCQNKQDFYRLFTQYEADFKLGDNATKKQHLFWMWKTYLICLSRTKSGRLPPVFEYFPATE